MTRTACMQKRGVKLQYSLLGEGPSALACSRRENDHRVPYYPPEQAVRSSHQWSIVMLPLLCLHGKRNEGTRVFASATDLFFSKAGSWASVQG